jgi:hypothetical protein
MSILRDGDRLFSGNDLHSELYLRERNVAPLIDAYDSNQFLNTPVDDLVAYFVGQIVPDAIVLDEAAISADEPEQTSIATADLPNGRFMYGDHQPSITGTQFRFFVPFKGDQQLFGLRASSFSSNAPRATVDGRDLVFSFSTADANGEAIKAEFSRDLNAVKNSVATQATQIAGFGRRIAELVRAQIDERRRKLLAAQKTVAAMGYRIRVRKDAPATYVPSSVRRKINPKPTASASAFAPEPALDSATYEHILEVIQNTALSLERSPSTFAGMKEEDLRQIFLVQLNGHYEGQATGETFNFNGKTDILVREEGKNLFIAECKFWHGPQEFTEAVDQLLGYLSWRDSKAAILIFNRDTALSTVLTKVPEQLRLHPSFKREIKIDDETRFRVVLTHRNDPSRELTVTVLAFDVPAKAKS